MLRFPQIDPERIYVADIETDGFLDGLTRVHLLTGGFLTSDKVQVFRRNESEDTIEEGLRSLQDLALKGYLIAFHNGIPFDLPAIQKVYPWFALPQESVLDTLVIARLIYADLWDSDEKLFKKGLLAGNLRNRQSLEAWGYRLGQMKGEYQGDTRIEDETQRKAYKWEWWNPDMEAYGIQDIRVTRALLHHLKPWEYSREAIELEHGVRWTVSRQERRGVGFDEAAAASLYGELRQLRGDLERELVSTVPPMFWQVGKTFTPKRGNAKQGYEEGAPLCKIELLEFNPTSRRHIARFLKDRYGWVPDKFTDTGEPAIDDEVLGQMDYPEAQKLARMFLLEKRIGQLAEGNKAWLKLVRDGRIHGSVNTNGAVTGRMTHGDPNLAQVPRVGTEFGAECRALYIPGVGLVMLGVDASGLELRMLGHYMARYDGGAYARAVVEGKSEDETDVHSLNCKALGLEPKKVYTIFGRTVKGRDIAKTFIYAFLYGAGDAKLGKILGVSQHKAKRIKERFLDALPALKRLIQAVKAKAKAEGYLRGLDGRLIKVRSQHAALNTLLQGAGAVVMKKALLIAQDDLGDRWVQGEQWEFVLNVHDEFQLEILKEIADEAGRIVVAAIRKAGECFNLRCPLDGEYKVGANWAETH